MSSESRRVLDLSKLSIVAFSDLEFPHNSQWQKCVVDGFKPDVVALAGDYNEGHVEWHKRITKAIAEDRNVTGFDFNEKCAKQQYENFYSFLEYAGQRAKVLVVKGNHENGAFYPQYDMQGGIFYSKQRINQISGCKEISGEIANVGRFCFLGLGYDDSKIVQISKRFQGIPIDVVVSHQSIYSLDATWNRIKPRIIINGHVHSGTYKVKGIPLVLTQKMKFASIILKDETITVQQFLKEDKNRSEDFSWLKNSRLKSFIEPYDFQIEGFPKQIVIDNHISMQL
jgi:Icc-related predicted phosphoesterase